MPNEIRDIIKECENCDAEYKKRYFQNCPEQRLFRTLKAVAKEIDYWANTPDSGEGAAVYRELREVARQAWEGNDATT